MKNIIIVVLVIASLFLLALSFIKADEADKSRILAEQHRTEAERLKDQAVQLQQNAMEAAAEARKHVKRAEQALADCQSK